MTEFELYNLNFIIFEFLTKTPTETEIAHYCVTILEYWRGKRCNDVPNQKEQNVMLYNMHKDDFYKSQGRGGLKLLSSLGLCLNFPCPTKVNLRQYCHLS